MKTKEKYTIKKNERLSGDRHLFKHRINTKYVVLIEDTI